MAALSSPGRTGVDAAVAESGREGRSLPFRRCDGLAVVVGVEDDGVECSGRFMFSEDDRRNAGNGEKLGFEVAGLQHGDERFGVALESGWIGGDVRNAEQ